MNFNAKKLVFKLVLGLAGLGLPLAALFFAALADHNPIAFESLESKTRKLTPVFNRVTYTTEDGRDVWQMQQSHQGFPANEGLWDEADLIAISISRDGIGSAQATFLQLTPAVLPSHDDAANLVNVEGFKAPCGMCHNNGPRAIRPNLQSAIAPLSYWDRWRIFVWNLKIKSYGRTSVEPSLSELAGSVPFSFKAPAANIPLAVEACTRCHKDFGPLARGTLTKQNSLSISFMVKNGFMPPLGIPLGDQDRQAVMKFVGL